jgi:hypothetical protein
MGILSKLFGSDPDRDFARTMAVNHEPVKTVAGKRKDGDIYWDSKSKTMRIDAVEPKIQLGEEQIPAPSPYDKMFNSKKEFDKVCKDIKGSEEQIKESYTKSACETLFKSAEEHDARYIGVVTGVDTDNFKKGEILVADEHNPGAFRKATPEDAGGLYIYGYEVMNPGEEFQYPEPSIADKIIDEVSKREQCGLKPVSISLGLREYNALRKTQSCGSLRYIEQQEVIFFGLPVELMDIPNWLEVHCI